MVKHILRWPAAIVGLLSNKALPMLELLFSILSFSLTLSFDDDGARPMTVVIATDGKTRRSCAVV